MNCVEFEDLWNEVLDARAAGLSELEPRLEEHTASCASCRSVSARYQTLRQAIGAFGPPPAPSAESASRLLALMVAPPAPAGRPPALRLVKYAWIPLATAAGLLAVAWPGGTRRPAPIAPTPSIEAPAAAFRPIDSALDEAKAATIGLALEASAPAARIGREVLGDRERPFELALAPASGPDRPAVDGPASPPSELLQTVGERVTASVRPISGSAWHAFSFLWPTPPPPAAEGSL